MSTNSSKPEDKEAILNDDDLETITGGTQLTHKYDLIRQGRWGAQQSSGGGTKPAPEAGGSSNSISFNLD